MPPIKLSPDVWSKFQALGGQRELPFTLSFLPADFCPGKRGWREAGAVQAQGQIPHQCVGCGGWCSPVGPSPTLPLFSPSLGSPASLWWRAKPEQCGSAWLQSGALRATLRSLFPSLPEVLEVGLSSHAGFEQTLWPQWNRKDRGSPLLSKEMANWQRGVDLCLPWPVLTRSCDPA